VEKIGGGAVIGADGGGATNCGCRSGGGGRMKQG